jgi:4-hydroxy-2-oxoheptanedioate aldolase
VKVSEHDKQPAPSLKQRLRDDLPSLGTRMITPWAGMIEVIGATGAFDYVEYSGEYSTYDLRLLDEMGRATELTPGLSSIIKLEQHGREFIAPRAVDAGFHGVLFADLRSAEDARQCVALIRPELPEEDGHPPGNHGAAIRRGYGYLSYAGSPAWVEAMQQVVVGVMIEKRQALAALDEILEVEGVDFVQFGPVDYSISVGKPGAAATPEIQALLKQMVERALETGVRPRVELASFEAAKPFLDMGVRHFCLGFDIHIIADWARRQADGMKKLLSEA